MKRRLRNRSASIAMFLLPLLLASGALVIAQQNTSSSNKELSLREIVKLPGKLLNQTKTDSPTSDLKLTGYRIEEVSLPRTVTTQVSGLQVTADTAWRVTVTGVPFPVRAMPAVIGPVPKIVLNTVRVPLTAFNSVNLNDIRSVQFTFDERFQGAVLIADVAFASAPR